ncbi:MAG TPA: fructose-bisphosphatase class III, partial [Pirellulales bacterium]
MTIVDAEDQSPAAEQPASPPKPSLGDVDARAYELMLLKGLSQRFGSVDAAMAEIARLSAVLTLPKGTVHVISDIHGEDKKLRHVINNASGTLRPLVERLFADRMDERAFQDFLTLT